MASSVPDSRLLLLMRHGKAESSSGSTDKDRALTERGHEQARLIGEYLESQGVRPTRVLVSDAVRTTQTWESVLAAMPGFDGKVTFHDEIYSTGAPEVAEMIRGRKDKHAVVMVIGHEPTIATLAGHFADEDSDPGAVAQARIGLPTGAMAVLSGPVEHWSDLEKNALTLHTIVRP